MPMNHPIIITSQGVTRKKTTGLGWTVQETIGIPIVNIRCVANARKTNSNFISTCGSVSLEVVKNYILEQKND